jgi:hypothetical protein
MRDYGRRLDPAAGAAATHPAAKLTSPLFPQISAAIDGLNAASLPAPENLYPVFRGREMGPNGGRLPENTLFEDDPWRSDLDTLKIAKARQDLSHMKLEQWITAAIDELKNPAPPDASSAAEDLRRRHQLALEELAQFVVNGLRDDSHRKHKQG